MTSHNILVVGTGAIGGFFASRLASLSQCRVSTVCRSNYRAVLDNGLRVTSPLFGDTTFKPKHVFANTEDARESKERWDWVFVATKATGEDGSQLLEGLVADGQQTETGIVVCQNGLAVEEPYWKRFGGGGQTVLSVVTRTSVQNEGPNHVRHNHWTRTTIGPYTPGADKTTAHRAQKSVEAFAGLLKEAGIPDLDVLDHIGMQFARWHKTAINASVNPTAVLAGGVTNQGVAIDDELYAHAKGVMLEILGASETILGRQLPTSLPKPDDVWEGVKQDTSGSKASMLVDWEAGRQVELEAILGEPLRQARAVGIELPRTQSLYALLRSAQNLRRQKSS